MGAHTHGTTVPSTSFPWGSAGLRHHNQRTVDPHTHGTTVPSVSFPRGSTGAGYRTMAADTRCPLLYCVMCRAFHLKLITSNVNSIRMQTSRAVAFQALEALSSHVIFLQETRLAGLQMIRQAQREWTRGASYWSLGESPYEGVGILFHNNEVELHNRLELWPGRCLLLDVCIKGVQLRLLNVYGPHSKALRKRLWVLLKPLLFTQRLVILGGDFNSVPEAQDREAQYDRPQYDANFLSTAVAQASLQDVFRDQHPRSCGFTYVQGQGEEQVGPFLHLPAFTGALRLLEAASVLRSCLSKLLLRAACRHSVGPGRVEEQHPLVYPPAGRVAAATPLGGFVHYPRYVPGPGALVGGGEARGAEPLK
nr:PREDICTED: uncharacterized protein LOC106702044 [Latimeria chalumnae]|eukprot:XP_014339655.1 PREDICTED: uncharacterized protein LOC106702044 [Latimeria chalumnae]